MLLIPIDERTSMDRVKMTEMMKNNSMNRFDLILRRRLQSMPSMVIKCRKS
jgi:hypothetical protein